MVKKLDSDPQKEYRIQVELPWLDGKSKLLWARLATMKLSATAKQDASLEGLNVKVQAKVGASVKGNATAELSAGGQTTVKGAMVMIN